MTDRVDALWAMLTDEWQSTAEIADRMMAAGFYPYRHTALTDIYSRFNLGVKYGLCEKRSQPRPKPTLWRRKA